MNMSNENKIELWERQPKETTKAYSYFCRFRDMGPDRTFKKVALELGKHYMTIIAMANKWNWIKRVEAYTDEMERVRMKLAKKEIEEMVKRHAQHAQAIETSLMMPIKIFMNKIRNEDIQTLQQMNAAELIKLVFGVADRFPNIVNTERKSRDVPTEISKQAIDHTTNGKDLNPAPWDKLKNDMLENLSSHPEAKEALLKVFDGYVDTGSKD
jgi:hypothetical protein